MPASSPTLSPTLSAITAGLRGSSSGMPASILPTRSAPTSAPFVKMPPPRRANTEISEPPKERPTSACTAVALGDVAQAQGAVVAGDAEQAEADDEDARDGAALEGDVEGLAETGAARLGDARVGAHRDVHADVARDGREHGADDEAERDLPAEVVRPDAGDQQDRGDDDGDDADGAVLAVEVGGRTLLDRRLDLAHALVAGRLSQHPAREVRAVGHGQQATDQGEEHVVLHQERLHNRLCSVSGRNQPDAARQALRRTAARAAIVTGAAGCARRMRSCL